jgi:hypothetical protein
MDIDGDRMPTMDHRGLVRIGGCWAVVGGMIAPGVTTADTHLLRLANAVPIGDFNCDRDVTLSDVGWFQDCVSGPESAAKLGCLTGDSDADGDVDWADYAVIQRAFGQ